MLLFLLVLGVAVFLLVRHLRNRTPPPRFLGEVPRKKHAVVIGGGIGGLCAAKVLTGYFEKVTLVDRDEFDLADAHKRSGVPQGQQLHGLLARGCSIVDRLFPGLVAEWRRCGASRLDMVSEFKPQIYGLVSDISERRRPGPSIYGVFMTRPFMEFHLRRRLLEGSNNLQVLTKTRATGLIYNAATGSVTGVRIKKRKEKNAGDEKAAQVPDELLADVVVCATGRRNNMEKWLAEINVTTDQEPVPQESAFPGLGYVTSLWHPPEGWFEKHPEHERAGFSLPFMGHCDIGYGLSPVENGDYCLLIFSYGKNYLPTSTEELLERLQGATRLDNRELLCQILSEWKLVREWIPYNDTRNVFRHYEKLGSRWPDNLFAIGDTVATFNPSFGQGMTNASMHADLLAQLLHEHFREFPVHDLSGLSLRFQKAAATVSENFWTGVQANDLQWPSTEGERTKLTTFLGFFQRHAWMVAVSKREYMFQFIHVTNGLLPAPAVFFKPGYLVPILVSMGKELWANWGKAHAKQE